MGQHSLLPCFLALISGLNPHTEFPFSMSNHSFSLEAYEQQLQQKIAQLQQDFAVFDLPEIQVFRSPLKHYRMRAEFKMWHEREKVSYAMFKPGEHRKPYLVDEFPIGSELINLLMPRLQLIINDDAALRERLFQIEFLTTLSGEVLVTLVYHKPLKDDWHLAAQKLHQALGIQVVGRSRGQKAVIGKDFVIEHLQVNEKTFYYQQVEASFTQPNAMVCEKMLSWAVNHSRDFGGDLVELYCGNGNFTLPLAQNFNRVLATEVAKTSVNSALYNMGLNGVTNVAIARMSSQEFSQALDKEREFYRLKEIDLDSYTFSSIFVDPPRAGMDLHTTAITQRFDNIIYISCNPETLRDNLQTITQTHDITQFAAFDQFPYTHHLECGVILKRKPPQ
jgi:tRNA (uracil-5-)-methyltransferase